MNFVILFLTIILIIWWFKNKPNSQINISDLLYSDVWSVKTIDIFRVQAKWLKMICLVTFQIHDVKIKNFFNFRAIQCKNKDLMSVFWWPIFKNYFVSLDNIRWIISDRMNAKVPHHFHKHEISIIYQLRFFNSWIMFVLYL